MSTENLPVVIREALDVEHPFIYNSWLKSGFRSRAYEMVAKEIYMLNQHDIITHVLARSNVLVAQELDKPENLYGYLVYQRVDNVFVVQYAYVKQLFRGMGILKMLLKAAGFNMKSSAGFYTHTTKSAHNIDAKFNLIYNPYLLINPKYEMLTSDPKKPVKPAPLLTNEALDLKDISIEGGNRE